MFQRHECKGICYYTSPILSEAGFRHMFCTRMGGVSTGDFASLNVSTARKDRNGFTDSARNVEENYRRILGVLALTPENACAAKQIHSDIVYTVRSSDGGKGILESSSVIDGCDGVLLTPDCDEIGAVCVKTADCVPILLANRETGAGLCGSRRLARQCGGYCDKGGQSAWLRSYGACFGSHRTVYRFVLL